MLSRGHDVPQELDLVKAIVFILILVPPEGDGHLVLEGRRLLDDPPLVPVLHCATEGFVVLEERGQVTSRTRDSLENEPERDVQMRAGQGSVEGLLVVDPREQPIT